jgi:hypothetical protein
MIRRVADAPSVHTDASGRTEFGKSIVTQIGASILRNIGYVLNIEMWNFTVEWLRVPITRPLASLFRS